MERPGWLERDKDEPPLCCVDADEVYRFLYTHSFGRHASIRIGKRRDEITVVRSHHPHHIGKPERFVSLLRDADWERVQTVIAAADFWSLPRFVPSLGACLDGFWLVVEGRRGERFHASQFRHPDVEEYWQLGRLAFDLGGLVERDL